MPSLAAVSLFSRQAVVNGHNHMSLGGWIGSAALFSFLLASGASASACDIEAIRAVGQRVELTYDIYLSGVRSGSVNVSANLKRDQYEIRAMTRSRGPVDTVIGFRSDALTKGACVDGDPKALSHSADNVWRGEERWVRTSFKSDGFIDSETMPDAAGDDREPVEPKERAGSTDPISAALILALQSKHATPCTGDHRVFDGRRLYRLTLTPTNEKTDRDAGEECFLTYTRLGGRSANPWWPTRNTPRRARVHYHQMIDGFPPIPTRVSSRAGLARLGIVLKKAKLSAISDE